jgi:hypothetical protein
MKFGTRAATFDRRPREECLAAIDSALSLASKRRTFSTADALDLLAGLQKQVEGTPLQQPVERAIAGAADLYMDTALIEASRLIDQLLDLRLAVSDSSLASGGSRVEAAAT